MEVLVMSRMSAVSVSLVLFFTLLLSAAPLPVRAQDATPMTGALPDGVEVVASGLTNPRGFTWGANGTLFVGLAGRGGDTPGPEGSPFSGGPTAGIAAIRDGDVSMLATGLASAIWRDIDWVWGVNDVAILGDQLYALVGGGGVGAGNPDQPSGVYVIAADGTATLVADLGTWVDENPVEYTPPEGAPNGGSFFDMAPIGEALWVVDSVNGQVLQVTPAGEITRIADLSEGHPVPSGIAVDPNGGAYVADLTPAPYVEGSAKVRHVGLDGTATEVWTGLTTVTGLAVGPDGTLYVAEMSSQISEAEPFLVESSGSIVRQTGPDTGETVASGLDYPVALGFGPDGGLYVSVPAFGADEGNGEIIRLEVPATS
jgi:hypothetical protein